MCPDHVTGSVAWDYDTSDSWIEIVNRTVLLDRNVSVAGVIVIKDGGKLIFKDFGEDASSPVTLRAMAINVKDGGELWIGSRSCRYKGKARVPNQAKKFRPL